MNAMRPFTTALEADVSIVSRKTMAEMAKGRKRSITATSPLPREPPWGRNSRNLAIAIDPSGRIHYGQDDVGGDHVVTVLEEQVSNASLGKFREDGRLLYFRRSKGRGPPGAMAQLASVFGVKRLVLEDGGRMNGTFLERRLIDEFSTRFTRRSRAWRARRASSALIAQTTTPGRWTGAPTGWLRDSGGRHGLVAPSCRRGADIGYLAVQRRRSSQALFALRATTN